MKIAQLQVPGGMDLVAPSGIPREVQPGPGATTKGIFQLGFNLLFMLVAFSAVVFLMYAGIQFITAGGDPQKLADAKRKMFYAIIGLVVTAGSYFIVSVVITVLGGENPSNFFAPGTLLNR